MTSIAHFISDGAWDRIVELARANGYVLPESSNTIRAEQARRLYGRTYRVTNRIQGISTFLNVLAYSEFVDTRSPDIRRRHELELETRHNPEWRLYRPRFNVKSPRYVTLYAGAAERYVEIARSVGILGKFRRGGPRKRSQPSIVSSVLEAVGCKLLTPVSIPAASTIETIDRRFVLSGPDGARGLQRVAQSRWTSSDDRE